MANVIAKLGVSMSKSPLRDFYGAEFPINLTAENRTYCPLLVFGVLVPAHSTSNQIKVGNVDQFERFISDIKQLSVMHNWEDAVILTMIAPDKPVDEHPPVVAPTAPATPSKKGEIKA